MGQRSKSERRIDHFFSFFDERLKFVENTCIDSVEGLILMCVYLDSLAGYRYGGDSSRKRFRDFLVQYGNSHSSWQKLSLWLISKDAKAGRLVLPHELLGVIDRLYGSVFNFCGLDYYPDVDLPTLEGQASGNMRTPFPVELRTALEKYEYASILWRKYRNPAVHQASIDPEAAPQFRDADEAVPFYRHLNHVDTKRHRIESEDVWFRIPATFIYGSLKESLANFRVYCEEHGLEMK